MGSCVKCGREELGRASFPGLSLFNGSSEERPSSAVSMTVPVLWEFCGFHERPGSAVSAGDQVSNQFSTLRPATRENSPTLSVTRVNPSDSVWAAIK